MTRQAVPELPPNQRMQPTVQQRRVAPLLPGR